MHAINWNYLFGLGVAAGFNLGHLTTINSRKGSRDDGRGGREKGTRRGRFWRFWDRGVLEWGWNGRETRGQGGFDTSVHTCSPICNHSAVCRSALDARGRALTRRRSRGGRVWREPRVEYAKRVKNHESRAWPHGRRRTNFFKKLMCRKFRPICPNCLSVEPNRD